MGVLDIFHRAPNVKRLEARRDVMGLIKALEYVHESKRRDAAKVRADAARSLGGLNDRGSVPALILALKDDDRGVVETAVRALSNLRDSRAIEPLIVAWRLAISMPSEEEEKTVAQGAKIGDDQVAELYRSSVLPGLLDVIRAKPRREHTYFRSALKSITGQQIDNLSAWERWWSNTKDSWWQIERKKVLDGRDQSRHNRGKALQDYARRVANTAKMPERVQILLSVSVSGDRPLSDEENRMLHQWRGMLDRVVAPEVGIERRRLEPEWQKQEERWRSADEVWQGEQRRLGRTVERQLGGDTYQCPSCHAIRPVSLRPQSGYCTFCDYGGRRFY